MATTKVKGLLSQLRTAAEAIKAQIHEADAQITTLTEQRRELTDAPVSKPDLVEFVNADIQRRAAAYQSQLERWARDSEHPCSFAELERNHVSGKQQSFPYLNGFPQNNTGSLELNGTYWHLGDLIAERFFVALDQIGYPDDLIPVADRRRMIAEIDAKLQELNTLRDGLAEDLISAGIHE